MGGTVLFSYDRRFLSDIDAHRTPHDAATTPNASRFVKLIMPGGEFVSHPLAVSRFGGRALAAAAGQGELLGKTGVPVPDALTLKPRQIGHLFHREAEAGGADHGAVSASEASVADVFPAGVIEIVFQQFR